MILPYGAYFISLCDHQENYILNTETFEMIQYNPETYDILTGYDITFCPLYNIKDICDANIKFVDTAIRFIIDNDENYKKYCQLTYNIFVKQEEKQVVFIDNTGSFLTSWIINALDTISPNDDLCIDISKDHKIPKKYNPETRLIIINNENYVPKLLQKGYKNIIIMKKSWNENKFINFIKENKETILSESHYKENENNSKEWWFKNLNRLSIEIFDSRILLFNNYLKWCCNK